MSENKVEFLKEAERIVLIEAGKKPIGEITWTIADGVMAINHTFVDSNYRGKGYAESLVFEATLVARQNNFKVNPICPYVAKEFKRKVEYQDLLVEQ